MLGRYPMTEMVVKGVQGEGLEEVAPDFVQARDELS